MAKQQYKNVKFSSDNYGLIAFMNRIIAEYIKAEYRLTVRQLYYQLVARGRIENTIQSYKRIAGIINDAKLAGEMDWEVIEDRTREFSSQQRWESPGQILRSAASGYHMDRWIGQDTRVFCIVEKEALVSVAERACREFDVPILAARGYPSGTVLREFVLRDIVPAVQDTQQECVILHLGDHDPSGIDMTRDLQERIVLFAEDASANISMRRIALNWEQVETQKPPPNPAKSTDSRYRGYMEKFGDKSWELDALRPDFINALISDEIQNCIGDPATWDRREEEIEGIRTKLFKVSGDFDKGKV